MEGYLKSFVRVLVIEDFEQFQSLITPVLQQRPNWKVIALASNGDDAVRLAKHFQPDLILVDMDLPRMNGVKVVRQIRTVAQDAKTVFFSHESSVGVILEAFRLGAWGYVIKEYASRELVTAVESVLQGRPFISGGVTGHDLSNSMRSANLDRYLSEILALPSLRKPLAGPHHELQFYSEHSILLDRATHFIDAALRADHSAIVCATDLVRNGLLRMLKVRGSAVDDAVARGSFIVLDAAETLTSFMVEGLPVPNDFHELMGRLITSASDAARGKHPRVALYEECAPLLWTQGKEEATVRVERLFNGLARNYDLDILCGYSLTYVHGEDDSHTIQRICAEHSNVHSE